MKELEDKIYEKIVQLCKDGDSIADNKFYPEAIEKYKEALSLIPNPKTEWQATTWILVAIADALFLDERFEEALINLKNAIECPEGFGNPFIHLRLGQCYYETGNLNQAAEELVRAYGLEGEEIFEDDDPKYLKFLKSRIDTNASMPHTLKKKYEIYLDEQIIGYSYLEKADAPMGCVFGKIESCKISYKSLKEYCNERQIELTADYPVERLIATRTIPLLKVLNQEKIEIKGLGNQICGIDSEEFEIHLEGIAYPFYEEEFPHHVKAYNDSFKE